MRVIEAAANRALLEAFAIILYTLEAKLKANEGERMTETNFDDLRIQAGSVFTPGSPVNERDLFAGRVEQLEKIIDATSQRGYHAILYGERGVGKTSLANILSSALQNNGWLVPRVNCDGSDNYSSLWKKSFRDIVITNEKATPGFNSDTKSESFSIVESLPTEISPDDVRRTIQSLSHGNSILIVFDEFDRLNNKSASTLMADTIKTLSDYSIPATILLIGVADSVDELIVGHQSIERAIVQIPMPRMSRTEISEIIDKGLERLGMKITAPVSKEIVALSQGLPYITHILALHSVRSALRSSRLEVTSDDVDAGIKSALDQWQQSIVRSYYDATRSSQPGNIYKPVLLACALAESDELGFFTAAAVRSPLQLITGRDYDIPNFAQHLKNFSDITRGSMLQRTGEKRRIRYRFSSPLMRPYIVMRGFNEKLIDRHQMQKLSAESE